MCFSRVLGWIARKTYRRCPDIALWVRCSWCGSKRVHVMLNMAEYYEDMRARGIGVGPRSTAPRIRPLVAFMALAGVRGTSGGTTPVLGRSRGYLGVSGKWVQDLGGSGLHLRAHRNISLALTRAVNGSIADQATIDPHLLAGHTQCGKQASYDGLLT